MNQIESMYSSTMFILDVINMSCMNRFFEAFHKSFKKVYFLSDFTEAAQLADLNPNHVGMVEQVMNCYLICSFGAF
jgi:hypothetical protein